MQARVEEINELLSTVAKLSEVASRNQLTFVTHLLDMIQLELTMVMFGYSDVEDAPEAETKPGKAAARPGPGKRGMARARRA